MRCADSATAAGASCRSLRCATTSTASANGMRRCRAPMWRSCWRWPTCWPPNRWPTAGFLDTYCTGYDRFERYLLGARRRRAEVAAVGVGDLRAARRRADRAGPADGRRAHHRHGQLVAAADPPRRAGAVDGSDAGGHAGPDRASRRRFRARLRLDERAGAAAAALPAAVAAAGPQPGADVHPGRGGQRYAAAPRRTIRLQRAAARPTPTSSACTGPAATRFTTTRTSPGCGGHWPASTPIVVHDPYWTAMAKHADIVVPSTTAFERDDYSGSRNDPLLMAMPELTEPYAQSRDDYTTFAALADALGFGEQFTEGRTAWQWLVHMYEKWAAGLDFDVPPFEEFWRRGRLRLPTETGLTLLADFRADPQTHRLATPSGRIEIFSADIDGFGYDDCAGHPKWYEPSEWLGGPAGGDLSAAPAGQPAGVPAAQPARRRRDQPGIRKCKGANRSGCTRPMPRLAGWSTVTWCGSSTTAAPAWPAWWSTSACAASGAAVDRRLVRPGRSRRPGRDVRARQSQCADRGCRHVVAGPRLHRCARAGAGARSSLGRCRRCGRTNRR